MDGWRGLPSAGADEMKLKPVPIKPQLDKETQHTRQEEEGEESEPVEPTPIIVKKEDISDVPCKVPKFQYVDFPSLHQCIQQLAIPPLENWLARCPAGWPPSRGSRDTPERIPKFKYVDYPSLHHCIQQLSVPPLESWSSGLARSVGSSGLRLGTGSSAPPSTANEKQGSLASGQKWDRDTALPGPSPGPVQKKAVSDSTSCKPQHSVRVIDQPEAKPLIGSGQGQPCTETTKGSEFQRPNFLTPHRATAQLKAGKRRQSTLNRMYLDMELDQMQPRGRPELRDSEDPEESFWRTVTESVCPFCQKMFTNPEELRVHQRSHRDKSRLFPQLTACEYHACLGRGSTRCRKEPTATLFSSHSTPARGKAAADVDPAVP
ncbi:hypothetical protein SKAU_G00328850 [Synaphobranchus kaupii]|uniref:C2H2-type domain-containing protein n=1 Tax=Synaphobranchus kaupii TaxID=118154 RepID=A0A9Q1EQ92_SYNKA|nr:hypothetical protein SKAU_G00328850 [Synaphobranchus kaupii]